MDSSKIIRVCVDGIYFQPHEFNFDKKIFSYKPDLDFGNVLRFGEYVSKKGTTTLEDHYEPSCDESFRKSFARELFIGPGGNGKSHRNLTDKGFIRALYVAPSWKLARVKQLEYGTKASVLARTEHVNYMADILKFNNVLIFDEVSQYTEFQKQQLFETYNTCKLIFCGDIGFQLPAITGNSMTHDGFDNVVELTENFRFTCDKHAAICNSVREMISGKVDRKIINDYIVASYENVTEITDYKPQDIIICSKHEICKQWDNTFPDNKWSCLEINNEYSRGDIVCGEKPAKGKWEKRHGYTIHSVQGETFEETIYIDARNLFDPTMGYTAISRARKHSQIKVITGLAAIMRTGYIYKISSPNTDKVYVGSTFKKDINERFKEHCKPNKYITSWEVIKLGNAIIELLDTCECVSRTDLEVVEKQWIIKTPNTVNIKLTKDHS